MPTDAPRAETVTKINDAIVALASGPGPAAISIIRYSGLQIFSRLSSVLISHKGEESQQSERYLRRFKFCDPENKNIIDDVMAVHYCQPRSFTGEDVVEVFCHGGPYVVSKILQVSYQLGFRAALPGEFSQRAFLNGKIDLTQAEGIKELTTAVSKQQWQAAIHLVEGGLKTQIEGLRNLLIQALSLLEARIDFPDEEDTAQVLRADVLAKARECAALVKRLMAGYKSGRVALQGFKVAIMGPPNAGKSTLLNYFVGHQRALVTPSPGTTRDYLEEKVLINGRLFRFFDTAGIRTDAEDIEKLGIDLSFKIAKDVDLILVLIPVDSSEAEKKQQVSSVRASCTGEVVVVASQSDKEAQPWAEEFINISTPNDVGLEALEKLLLQKVDENLKQLEDDESYICNPRHLHALHAAEKSLNEFFKIFAEGAYDEMLAFELIHASKALNQIIGDLGNEDILDHIFSQFCLGK